MPARWNMAHLHSRRPRTALSLPDLSRPRTSYMLSKIYGEAMCRQAGVPVTIIRPHNIYGPRMGMAHVIPELLNRARMCSDGRLEVYSVDHRRTFCYVEDAVETIVRAVRSPRCEGETLNVGTQFPEISIGELAERIVEVVGRHSEQSPATASWLAGATLPGHDADPRGDWLRRGGRHRGRRPGKPTTGTTERIRGLVVRTRFAD